MALAVLDRPIHDIADLVRRGEVSAEALARAALARSERHNPAFGAFLTVQGEEAVEAARAIDKRRAKGEALGPLAGVPIGLKDALCTRDVPTTAGSAILTRAKSAGQPDRDPWRGFRPPYD